MRSRRAALLFVSLGSVLAASCSDPVREQAIADLGPETPGGPGPDHRRGQPCLLCHDAQGQAKTKFVTAGTIYDTPAPDAPGAKDIEVQFVDATGGGPLEDPVTSPASGNFWVLDVDWPDLTFPFKVRLLRNGAPVAVMTTTANRTGDCNFCHRPNAPDPRRSYGQIYVNAENKP